MEHNMEADMRDLDEELTEVSKLQGVEWRIWWRDPSSQAARAISVLGSLRAKDQGIIGPTSECVSLFD